ncbi:MAG: carboxypeptidase-like regulatory domain-containing protein, partial [Bacteroidota bacterium]
MNKQYMLLSLSLLAFAFGLGWTMYDDPLTIKGYVRDAETQEPLIGATILVKGTNNGALTDINGFYQLRVPDEQKSGTLVVSFIGYRRTSSIQAQRQKPVGRDSIAYIACSWNRD